MKKIKMIKKSKMKNKFKIIFYLAISCVLVSCVQKVEKMGYFVKESNLELVKPNKSSEQEVINILGDPTTKSAFGAKTYYYMERQYKQMAFFTPKLMEQRVIAIEFKPNDIVSKISVYGKDGAKVLGYDAEKVTFEGNKVGVFEQMVGNIGKFSSQAQKGAAK